MPPIRLIPSHALFEALLPLESARDSNWIYEGRALIGKIIEEVSKHSGDLTEVRQILEQRWDTPKTEKYLGVGWFIKDSRETACIIATARLANWEAAGLAPLGHC